MQNERVLGRSMARELNTSEVDVVSGGISPISPSSTGTYDMRTRSFDYASDDSQTPPGGGIGGPWDPVVKE